LAAVRATGALDDAPVVRALLGVIDADDASSAAGGQQDLPEGWERITDRLFGHPDGSVLTLADLPVEAVLGNADPVLQQR
jgi:hypothetical protein